MPDKKKRTEVPPPPGRFGPLEQIWEQIRLAGRLLGDNRVPMLLKVIPLAAIAYAISPVDLVPGLLFIGIGMLDDIGILALALITFISLAPEDVVVEHLRSLRFGAKYRVHRDKDGVVIDVKAEHVSDKDEPAEAEDDESLDAQAEAEPAAARRSRR